MQIRVRRPILFMACLFLSSYALQAQAEMTTGFFYQRCPVLLLNETDEILCRAYISGLIAGLAYGKMSIADGKTYCLPDGLDYAQATLLIRRFIESRSRLLATTPDLGRDVGPTATIALTSAFDCTK